MLLGIFLFGFITSLTAVQYFIKPEVQLPVTNLIKYKLTITSNNAPINVNMTVSVDNCTSGRLRSYLLYY
jgi:hypothetical protein